MAGLYNFTVRAGNTGTVENQSGLSFTETEARAVADYEYVFFTATFDGGSIRKTSATGDILKDTTENTVTVPFTTAETRSMLVPGTSIAYEMERRTADPTQVTFLTGEISVLGSLNDD